MYHYVRPLKDSRYPEIKGLELEGFDRQIAFFKNNFEFITALQLVNCIYDDRNSIPKNSLLLTFDDGLKDHYLHVLPTLKKHKIQGLFFIPVKIIENKYVLDVHKIHFILATCKNKIKLVNEIFSMINEHRREYSLQSPESYFEALAIPNRFDPKEVIFIKRILQRELPKDLRAKFTDYLFEEFVTNDERSFSKELYLSFNEIREMKEEGMYFGSHGYTHEWLSSLSEIELDIELQHCLNFYSKINGNLSDLIMCYPYGDFNDLIIKKLKERGYKVGLTTQVGDATLNEKNAFTLKRFDTNDFPQ